MVKLKILENLPIVFQELLVKAQSLCWNYYWVWQTWAFRASLGLALSKDALAGQGGSSKPRFTDATAKNSRVSIFVLGVLEAFRAEFEERENRYLAIRTDKFRISGNVPCEKISFRNQ